MGKEVGKACNLEYLDFNEKHIRLMRYMKVLWLHNSDDEPRQIYSEIDDASYELRKVEIYNDSSFGMASGEFVFGGTQLAGIPIPEIEYIAGDTELIPHAICKAQFEKIWSGCMNYLDESNEDDQYRKWGSWR